MENRSTIWIGHLLDTLKYFLAVVSILYFVKTYDYPVNSVNMSRAQSAGDVKHSDEQGRD